MKEILSGNEAIARGAWEAGAVYAVAYPGTPSTEILETIGKLYGPELYSQWSPNEKTALETAVGASMAGGRAIACMKHVGVNVAADPLFTATYTGVNGGLVLVTADDPDQHSSQNEQDNRNYAKFAKVPLIEPSDSQEAKDFLKIAFEISEQFDTPVIFRTTTRISHSKSVVELGAREERPKPGSLTRDIKKYAMLPAYARPKHPLVEKRISDLAVHGVDSPLNRVEMGNNEVGIITSGISYQYAKEAMPDASFLKLGLTYPIPENLILDFARKVKRLIIVEELDPFLEEQVRLLGITVTHGKDYFSNIGELEPALVNQKLTGTPVRKTTPAPGLPVRPPVLCPGCSHRGVAVVLRKLKVYVSGDISCFTLAALPPLEAVHACLCMGASITMAHGMSKVLGKAQRMEDKLVAVIGDSTVFHSGMSSLVDLIWNAGNAVVIIQDNRTTAMTGGQENPGSGHTLNGVDSPDIDVEKLVLAMGLPRENVHVVNSYDLTQIETVLRNELAKDTPSVVITKDPCVLRFKVSSRPMKVDPEKCTACKVCLKVGCISISMVGEEDNLHAEVDNHSCTGCGVCAQVCKFEAILKT